MSLRSGYQYVPNQALTTCTPAPSPMWGPTIPPSWRPCPRARWSWSTSSGSWRISCGETGAGPPCLPLRSFQRQTIGWWGGQWARRVLTETFVQDPHPGLQLLSRTHWDIWILQKQGQKNLLLTPPASPSFPHWNFIFHETLTRPNSGLDNPEIWQITGLFPILSVCNDSHHN